MQAKYVLTIVLSFLLSLSQAQDQSSFRNSFWQWVEGANVSDKRMREIAPHFPHPKDVAYDMEQYNFEIVRWQKIYCFEYEALVNAPELTASNPYYDGYQDIIQLPYFIRPLSSFDKPTKKNTGNEFEDQLEYELDMQAWYFVFEPAEFYKIYKIKPTFPSWFDADAYKTQVIKKIEETFGVKYSR